MDTNFYQILRCYSIRSIFLGILTQFIQFREGFIRILIENRTMLKWRCILVTKIFYIHWINFSFSYKKILALYINISIFIMHQLLLLLLVVSVFYVISFEDESKVVCQYRENEPKYQVYYDYYLISFKQINKKFCWYSTCDKQIVWWFLALLFPLRLISWGIFDQCYFSKIYFTAPCFSSSILTHSINKFKNLWIC